MDLYTDEEIGKIIKRMKVYKNLTQGELDERLGVKAAVRLSALKGCISTAFFINYIDFRSDSSAIFAEFSLVSPFMRL